MRKLRLSVPVSDLTTKFKVLTTERCCPRCRRGRRIVKSGWVCGGGEGLGRIYGSTPTQTLRGRSIASSDLPTNFPYVQPADSPDSWKRLLFHLPRPLSPLRPWPTSLCTGLLWGVQGSLEEWPPKDGGRREWSRSPG